MVKNDSDQDPLSPLITLIKKIRADATLAKKKHYNASIRKQRFYRIVGTTAVLIDIFLGSLLLYLLTETIPKQMKWFAACSALVAALLNGIQTYFNWGKQSDEHTRVAQRYLFLAKECDHIIATYESKLKTDMSAEADRLRKKYEEITLDADAYPTNDSDYLRAVDGIGSGEETYSEIDLRISG